MTMPGEKSEAAIVPEKAGNAAGGKGRRVSIVHSEATRGATQNA